MTTATRKGDWMQTAGNRKFWPLDPRPEEVFIEDIAWSLGHLARYNGHANRFYSVAEHSVLVSYHLQAQGASKYLQFVGLMHDATEAYVADVPRPLKPFLTGYAAIEQRVWEAIADRFDMPYEIPSLVKKADDAVLLAEKPVLLGTTHEWKVHGEAATVSVVGYRPRVANTIFLHRFRELTA